MAPYTRSAKAKAMATSKRHGSATKAAPPKAKSKPKSPPKKKTGVPFNTLTGYSPTLPTHPRTSPRWQPVPKPWNSFLRHVFTTVRARAYHRQLEDIRVQLEGGSLPEEFRPVGALLRPAMEVLLRIDAASLQAWRPNLNISVEPRL